MSLQIEKLSQLIKSKGMDILSFIEGDSEEYEDSTSKGKIRFQNLHKSAFLYNRGKAKIEVKKMNQSFSLIVLKASKTHMHRKE